MDKLALMHPLEFKDDDAIHFLINGINNLALKSAAATIHADSIDHFLDEMHHITAVCTDSLRKNIPAVSKYEKPKGISSSFNKPKVGNEDNSKGSSQEQDSFCVYCRNKGHLREDCFKLR